MLDPIPSLGSKELKPTPLNADQIAYATKDHGVEPAALMAVIWVETPKPHIGDYEPNKPLILFERHKFYKYSGSFPVSRDYPTLSNKNAGGYCKGANWRLRQACEHRKLQNAMTIYDGRLVDAALMSISMGLFQIMGFNHTLIDQPSVGSMWERYKKINDELDLEDFFRFCTNTGLLDELQRRDWARFARGYNGVGYRRNQYDTLLARYYRQFKREGLEVVASIPSHSTISGFPDFSQGLT